MQAWFRETSTTYFTGLSMDLQSDGTLSFSEITAKDFHSDMDIYDILKLRIHFCYCYYRDLGRKCSFINFLFGLRITFLFINQIRFLAYNYTICDAFIIVDIT